MSRLRNTIYSRKGSSVKDSDLGALNIRILTIKSGRSDDESQTADVPIAWERISSGYRIVDLRLDRFMQALQFANYFETEPLCRAVGLASDALSMRSVTSMIFEKMESMMSFVALREGTNDLVGVLIASFFDEAEFAVPKEKGETLHQVALLKSRAIARAEFYEATEAEKFVYIDLVCVKSDHQKRGIGTALLRSCVVRASSLASACVGEFTSGAGQTIAKRLEFDVVYELPYSSLESEDGKFRVFEVCHPENYSIACMTVRLSPPRYSLPVIPEPISATKPARKEKNAKRKKK